MKTLSELLEKYEIDEFDADTDFRDRRVANEIKNGWEKIQNAKASLRNYVDPLARMVLDERYFGSSPWCSWDFSVAASKLHITGYTDDDRGPTTHTTVIVDLGPGPLTSF